MMKKEIIIPTSLHEISLDNYIKLQSIDLEDTDNIVYQSLDAVFGLPKATIDAMSQKSIETLANKIKEITEQEYLPMYQFPINGVLFGMIPNFSAESVAFKEYTDSSAHIDQILKGSMNADSFKRFMAIIFRPIIKEENGLIKLEPYESSEKYYDIMGRAPASAFKGAESFFLTLRTDLLKCSQTYIAKEEAPEIQALANHLRQSGVGTEVLETLQNLAVKQ